MSWLFVALLAQFILGSSAVFDKSLLRQRFFNPLSYSFWLGALGIFSLVLVPLGFHFVPLKIFSVAVLAGVFFVIGMAFLFFALNKMEASDTLPIIGSFSPIFTLAAAYYLLGVFIGLLDFTGFALLIMGALVLFFTEKRKITFSSLVLMLLSAFLLGLSNVLAKIVFSGSNFITGFVLIKITGAVFSLIFLFSKSFRKKVFAKHRHKEASNYLLYFSNRLYAGIGSVFGAYAIFLSKNPALVDVTQGFKYVVIFFGAWLFLKEKFKGKVLLGKIFASVLIIFGVFVLGVGSYTRSLPKVDDNMSTTWGITYSTKFSSQLGLDWKKNFEDILIDLKPKKIRLVAYWDEIEKKRGVYDFSQLDWLINKAEQNGVKIILTVGLKAPRWPECHEPQWVQSQNSNLKNQKLFEYIEKVVNSYKDNLVIEAWQVENEPFLKFGECQIISEETFKKEIELVRSIDKSRPIIATDGGEFGLWYKAARNGDIFGTTMYRNVYIDTIGISWLFGNINYPFNPNYFRLKEKIVRYYLDDYNKKFIVSELQAEPWSKVALEKISYEKQTDLFSPAFFDDTVKYAKKAGFDEYYLWGAEWWYYMKEKYGDTRYWEIAKSILR